MISTMPFFPRLERRVGNLDALNDSIRSNDISAIRSPFRITIAGAVSVPADLQEYLFKFADLPADLRGNRACEVYLVH